jgi:hypothetical protein
MDHPLPAWSAAAAKAALALATLSLLCLAALHVLSPEIEVSWHMVSEYAYGSWGGVLRAFFLAWGLAAWAATAALVPLAAGVRGRMGLLFLLASGAGAIGGGLFDVRHELHGLSFGLGVPTLPVAALLLSGPLARRAPGDRSWLRVAAHATWLSVVLMAVAMVHFISSLERAGAFHPESQTMLTRLPDGVTSLIGYPNRLLVVAYLCWIMLASRTALRAGAGGRT